MSISAIGSISTNVPEAKSSSTRAAKPTQTSSAAPSKPAHDTVTVSAAALSALAALKESVETPAQTAIEAGGGDHQAQRLLAREAALRAAGD